MKRVFALLLSLVLMLSAIPISFGIAAADDVTQAVIWEDFSRRAVGEKFDDSEIICAETQGSATCVNTLGALGAVNAAKFDYDSLRGYHNISGDQGFKIVYNEPKSLKNVTHMVYYFKMPISRTDDEGNNWGKSGVAIMLYLGDYIWAQLKEGTVVEYLSKDGYEWKSIKSNGMYLDLPSGFEGYIKISLEDYASGSLKDSIHNHSVEQTILQFSNMGGVCGAGYLNVVYGITQNTNGIKVKLNGEKNARYYTTGLTESDLSGSRKLLQSAMKAEILQNFSSYPVGYRLDENGLVSYQHKKNIITKLVSNISGLLNNPSVEISSPTLGGFHDSDPFYEIKYPAFTYTDGMQAIMFYIKSAAPHPLQTDYSTFRFNIYTEKDGVPTWTLLGNGTAKYLQRGSSEWRVAELSGDGQGIMYMPPNFEGYIMIDVSEMQTNPIADDLEGRSMISSTLQFQAVGGDAGSCYVDAIYKITEKTDKRETLITFNDCDVYCLSDNELAEEQDLIVKGPEVGEEYDSIPTETTTDYSAKVSDISSGSCVVSYDEVKGVSQYRIDVYSTVSTALTGAIKYRCDYSMTVDSADGLKTTVRGLQPSTRYYVVVNALNKTGEATKIYKFRRFSTKSATEVKTSVSVGTAKNGSGITVIVHESGESGNVGFIIGGAALAVLIIGGAVALIILKKRRKAAIK